MRSFLWLAWLVLIVGGVRAAFAEISTTDLQVAARALSFMENPLSGRVRLGIVYAPESPRSRTQAEALMAQIGSGMTVGTVDLRPVLVPLESAGTAAVDLFLLTEHLPASSRHLADISRDRQIPCVTTEVDKVESGTCTLAVRSRPKVEIIVNRAAAQDAGVRFATAFRVMVTEL